MLWSEYTCDYRPRICGPGFSRRAWLFQIMATVPRTFWHMDLSVHGRFGTGRFRCKKKIEYRYGWNPLHFERVVGGVCVLKYLDSKLLLREYFSWPCGKKLILTNLPIWCRLQISYWTTRTQIDASPQNFCLALSRETFNLSSKNFTY